MILTPFSRRVLTAGLSIELGRTKAVMFCYLSASQDVTQMGCGAHELSLGFQEAVDDESSSDASGADNCNLHSVILSESLFFCSILTENDECLQFSYM